MESLNDSSYDEEVNEWDCYCSDLTAQDYSAAFAAFNFVLIILLMPVVRHFAFTARNHLNFTELKACYPLQLYEVPTPT